MPDCIAAIDQGTTSTRCMIFDRSGNILGMAQQEHSQIYPRAGWVEHDPLEIRDKTWAVIRAALAAAGRPGSAVAAAGITNQRETTVVWERATGRPVCNAVVWQCTRTHEICRELAGSGGADRFRERTGLPVATYFSGPKLRWILDNIPGAASAARAGDLLFGTMETWLNWWLTGGPEGGVHVTDVTNASRTLMMNLSTLDWDPEILSVLGIPRAVLPRIVASSDPSAWGATRADGPFGSRVPICGALGDQQAALVGQACFSPGEAKNTYGTGCFLLINTGPDPVVSRNGLLTTLAYRFGEAPPVYCLEGAIAIAGALVQWLRDNLGLIPTAPDIETLARTADDNGGAYIVPAFSGLFAPYWRADARGVITGLTRYCNKGHLARAALEACAYQTRDIVETMRQDAGVALSSLKVDGGMVANDLLMQFQADILNVPVVRPQVAETTALGAAYAAGLAVGFWTGLEEIAANWAMDRTWTPELPEAERQHYYRQWQKAVQRTFNWVD